MSFTQRTWFPWAAVSLLALVCSVLAWHQYYWLGEISQAQLRQLREQLDERLAALGSAFDERTTGLIPVLEPTPEETVELGVEAAVQARLPQWKKQASGVFSRVGLATFQGGEPELRLLDEGAGELRLSSWPAEWASTQTELLNRSRRGGPGRGASAFEPGLIAVPIFRPGPPGRGFSAEPAMLFLELNNSFVREEIIPELMTSFLRVMGQGWDVAVLAADDTAVFETSAGIGHSLRTRFDARTALTAGGFRRGFEGRGFGRRGGPGGFRPGRGFQGAGWNLYVRHHAGSLETMVDQVRYRSLEVSGAMLLLIIGIAALLVRVSRETGRLASLQMSFVTGVSHELRTPLTVIRTAAYNLRGKLSRSPEQVERYGTLIQEESEKLTALVEQVLQFSRARSGYSVREKNSIEVRQLLDSAIRSSLAAADQDGFELQVEDNLPPIKVDEAALSQALRNLIDNAVKYSGTEKWWVGIFAARNGDMLQIRVADRGHGIDPGELPHIFEPFYRGRRAIDDQIHGTGLGLSLARAIVEAHGGTISALCPAAGGSEFTVSLPLKT